MRFVYWGCGVSSLILGGFVWWLISGLGDLIPSTPFRKSYKIETGEKIIVSGKCDASFTSDSWCSYDVQLERKNKKLEFLGSDIAGIEKAYSEPPSSFHFAKFADYSSITTDRAVYFRQNGDDKWTQWDYPMFGGEVHRLRRALKPFNPLERRISASDMKLPHHFYSFERCDPKNELLIFRDKDFRAVFRSGNGGFKFDEKSRLKHPGVVPLPSRKE